MMVQRDCSIFVLVVLFASLVEGGQRCASCSGVEDSTDCDHVVTCADDKACFMHNYVTESGIVSYDLGCSSDQACHHVSGPIVGRRSEGHSILCTLCCNDTSLCNQHLNCSSTGHPVGKLPRECSEVKDNNPHVTSGVYTIYPYTSSQVGVNVYCRFDAQYSWTMIQRRYNGSVDFYRNWASYKEGFGSPYGEYWLGNDIIHELTSHALHDLRIEMTDFDGVTKYAEYTLFHVGDEENGYRLTIEHYSGDAGDCLRANGAKFSTYDVDNDSYSSSCAVQFKGAWWYTACHCGNLNGKYYAGHHDTYADGIDWSLWHGQHYSLKTVNIMIRKY